MNYYQLLGIAQEASPDEIKRAYYTAVKKHSPDKDPENFKLIRAAYDTLSKTAGRTEYDKIFKIDATDKIKQDLLKARDLFNDNRYKQIIEMFTDGKKPITDNPEANIMLANAYLRIGKSGTADTLLKKVLAKDPDNADAIVVLSQACIRRGHTNKALEHLQQGLKTNTNHLPMWKEYFALLQAEFHWLLRSEVCRAYAIDKNIFEEIYPICLIGCDYALEEDMHDEARGLMGEYVKHLCNDTNLKKSEYAFAVVSLAKFSRIAELRPYILEAVPVLVQNKHYDEKAKMMLENLHLFAELDKMTKDSRIHEVLHDLTELLIDFDDCEECADDRNSMEMYIISHLEEVRPSVKIMSADYPELYKLNAKFYSEVLDLRKEDSLIKRGMKKFRQLSKSGMLDRILDDENLGAILKPFLREAPKIGRNDPCPCGSGKKYKKCCG